MAAQTAPMTLEQMSQSHWQGVIYGPPGCGKTCTATTTALNAFVFDVDQSMNSALAFRRRLGMRVDNILVWRVRTVQDFDAATSWLEANIRSFAGGVVVVDSATELQRIVIREVVAKSRALAPDQRQWGDVRTLMENLTVKFRYMPFHLVYTCHEVAKADPDFGREVWRPSFDGRFAFEYAKHFSYIARLVARPTPTGRTLEGGLQETAVQRWLSFGPDPYAHFKDRSGVMSPWEQPSLDPLLARMIASTSGEAAPAQPATAQGGNTLG